MKIFKDISSPRDSIALQEDLNNFAMWCSKNNLELNIGKCQSITYSRKRLPSHRDYFLNSTKVDKVNTVRDLGILCDSELNFRLHFNDIICRANSALGFVKRWSKEFSDPHVTRSLYMTFVRPILEYGSQVWSPYHEVHIKRIEDVQRRFVRFALRGLGWNDPFHLPPYGDRLRIINLQTLEKRRKVADIVFVHQTISGGVDCPSFLDKINFNINFRSLRSIPLFKLQTHRTDYGKNEPFSRMLSAANEFSIVLDFHLGKDALKRLLYS